ncbi:MAG: hypothetical protein CL610_29950 [Anaerolineaceae bacterium]|nr:hypothetical protein [Anaerolineaceae bacterium]
MFPVFAVTTRGLEALSAAEMQSNGFTVTGTRYRRVEAACTTLDSAANLRTVDDVFFRLDQWHDIRHTRDQLQHLRQLTAALDLGPALAAIATLRPLPHRLSFSITANYVGKRNYSVPEIKTQMADGVLSQHGHWRYVEEDDAADLNLRLFLEHTEATVGARLLAHPLHRRPYKQHHAPGSLKPTVAAAMLQLAQAEPGQHLIDPFCGAGTVLIEASLAGLNAVGGDIDADVLQYAAANARSADLRPGLMQWDATRIPLPCSSMDLAITNPPWGRQITVDASLTTLYQRAFDDMRRVVRPGGHILILTTYPDLIPAVPDDQLEISVFGQNPVILHYTNA